MSSQFNCSTCTGNSTFCSNSTEEDCDTDIHLHVGLRVLQAIVLVAITLACFGINSVVLIVNVTRKTLHTRNFLLPLQIICSNLLYSVTVLPFSVVSSGAGDWILGHGMCQFVALANSVAITNQFCFSLVMPLDKIFSIFLPFWYQRKGFRVSLIMSVIAWLVMAVSVILPLDGILDCYGYMPRFKTCAVIVDNCIVFPYLVQALLFFLGVGMPFVLNAALFLKARKMCVQILPSTGTSEEDHQELVSRRKRERRAINTVLILFSVLLFLKMPLILLYFLVSFIQHPVVVYINEIVINPCFYLLFVVDPLVILRNKDFKAETRKMLKDVKEKAHVFVQDYFQHCVEVLMSLKHCSS